MGYYCTITSVRTDSIRQSPNDPDQWTYRVFVPHFRKYLDVVSRDLYVTGICDSESLSRDLFDKPRRINMKLDAPTPHIWPFFSFPNGRSLFLCFLLLQEEAERCMAEGSYEQPHFYASHLSASLFFVRATGNRGRIIPSLHGATFSSRQEGREKVAESEAVG